MGNENAELVCRPTCLPAGGREKLEIVLSAPVQGESREAGRGQNSVRAISRTHCQKGKISERC